MKSKLIPTCLIIFCVFNCQILIGQENEDDPDKCVKSNFLDENHFDKCDYLIAGKTYVFEINNINRHIYKITSSTTQEEFNMEIPSVFKDVNLPGFINLSIPDGKTADGTEFMSSNLESDLKDVLNKISEYNSQLTETAHYDNFLSNMIKTCGEEYTEIEEKLEKETRKYMSDTTKTDRVTQVKKIRNFLNTLVTNAVVAEVTLKSLFENQNKKTKATVNVNKDSLLKLEISLPDASKDLNSDYAENKVIMNGLNRQNEERASYLAEIKTKVDEALAVINVIKQFKTDNKIELLIKKYKLINKSNFTFISEPIKVKKDEVTFTLTATSEELLPCDIQNQKTIKKTFVVKGGWKVDFSTGVFFNGGDDDFFGRELYYTKTTATTTTINAKDGGNRLLLGLGGLMHIYKRSDKNVKWAISPGLSSSTDFDQLNFHLGGSAIFGNKNRLVITAGVTLRESEILDKTFKLDTEYTTEDLPESPPTIKVFPRFGYFISLTYNFSKFKS